MTDCRSISQEAWEEARVALVFYFSRRHGFSNAEDLAQETLLVVFKRSDFKFENEGQFLRVVYGFASRISKQAYRQSRKNQGQELDPALSARQPRVDSLRGPEVAVFFKQVCREGEAGLSPLELQLVRRLMESDVSDLYKSFKRADSNKMRVRLHRVRAKLRKLSGLSPPGKPSPSKSRIDLEPGPERTAQKEPLQED